MKYCIRRLPLHHRKPLIHFRSWNTLIEAAEIIDIAYHHVSVLWFNKNIENWSSNVETQPSQIVLSQAPGPNTVAGIGNLRGFNINVTYDSVVNRESEQNTETSEISIEQIVQKVKIQNSEVVVSSSELSNLDIQVEGRDPNNLQLNYLTDLILFCGF